MVSLGRPYVCLSRPYHFKFFKGRLLQILLGPFLSTLSHMKLSKLSNKITLMHLRRRHFFLQNFRIPTKYFKNVFTSSYFNGSCLSVIYPIIHARPLFTLIFDVFPCFVAIATDYPEAVK